MNTLQLKAHLSLVWRTIAASLCKFKCSVFPGLSTYFKKVWAASWENLLFVCETINCAFVFPTKIVKFLCFLYPKCQAFSRFLWLYSLVCVRPGQKSLTGFLVTQLISPYWNNPISWLNHKYILPLTWDTNIIASLTSILSGPSRG